MSHIEKLTQIAKVASENGRDYSKVINVKPIQGGSINEAYYVQTEDAEYFMKFHSEAPKGFFKSEAIGLRIIKETGTIAVPNYLSYSDQPGNAFLLLEWINGEKTAETEVRFGRKLADLHKTFGQMHGFKDDTYIGLLPQPNELKANWLEYYRDFRLQSQLNQGIDREVITGERRQRLETLLGRLDEWIPRFVEPSHLHGDLYNGNWIVGPGGEPYIVDPSFLYGDRHFEIAFSEMFGGLPEKFYEAYNESFPLREDYEDIKELYQLYYLLAHLNLFGESYGSGVDTILKKYIG